MELRIEGVNKYYRKKHALKDFSCVFNEGVNVLLGPNGAGKTTLMNCIADVINFDNGKISFDGEDTLKMGKKFRKRLGYLPQNPEFYPFFTGRQIINYFAVLKGIEKDEYNVMELLESVNLADVADKSCGSYSGGMKRRLGIAVTLLGSPAVMIFDEPTAGLDPKERISFKNILKDLSENHIIILSTHIISDAEDVGCNIVLIKEGKILTEGSMEELKSAVSGQTLDDVYLNWFN